MDSEINALHSNRTWELVLPDSLMNVLSCKWIFWKKFDKSGNIERLKALLVANGMRQVSGMDVTKTFAPIVMPASAKLILSFTITWGWQLKQYDVSNVYLHGLLKENVYMKQLLGYKDLDQPTTV